jgi:hypothetical protein
MSYLENGSTLRSMFRLMLPLRHDIDPTRSEVITHIKDNLRCDIGRAIRAFNSMRHKKSQVLVYDMVHRQWRGCDWVPPEEGDKVALLTRAINEMKRELFALKSEVRKQGKLLGQLERKRSRKREREEEEGETVELQPEPEPQQQEAAPPEKEEAASGEDWFKAMREALDDRPEASAPSVEPPSSPSGSTGPTRFRWESAGGLVPMP